MDDSNEITYHDISQFNNKNLCNDLYDWLKIKNRGSVCREPGIYF